MIIAAILLALVQPAELDENTPFTERQPVRLAPLATERALGAFRDICMAGFPDSAAFDQAAAASDLGFVRREEPQRGAQEWSSSHGHIVLRQAPNRSSEDRRARREGRAARQHWLQRCDLWVAIEDPDIDALVGAIGEQLAPGRPPIEEILGVAWDMGPSPAGGTLKLVYIPSTDDPRLFTLSLQRIADNPSR
jgi:hypothetical protein